MVHLGIGFQFSGVGNTSLVSCRGEAVVDKVEFVWGAKNRTQAVETVPFCYCVGEDFWVGMSVCGVQLHVELVGEDFFCVASQDKGKKGKNTKSDKIIFCKI